MFKTLFLFCLLLVPVSHGLAKVTFRWLSIAGMALDDGETRILFDPVLSRPNWRHWVLNEKFGARSIDELKHYDPQMTERLKAIFISHTHFDHAADAPLLSHLSGATIYANDSMEQVVKAHQDLKASYAFMDEKRPIKVGKFTVTALHRTHSKLMGLIHFLPGKIGPDFDLSFYSYREGSNRLFLVEHENGTILVDVGHFAMNEEMKRSFPQLKKIDVLIQSYYDNDVEATLAGHVKNLNPKLFVPIHFDNFFTKEIKSDTSFLLNLTTMQKRFAEQRPDVKVVVPKFKETIVILEKEGEAVASPETH